MKVIIIEDEKPAAEKLQKALIKINSEIIVEAILSSVQASVEWLKKNLHPDLFFMDIELTDGLSFEIFEKVAIDSPVIFTTAYDEYWQEAFECNSIDYLLKPLRQEKLDAALNKYEKLKQHFAANFQQLLAWKSNPKSTTYRQRFLVKRGSEYVTIKTDDVAYFYAIHKVVCLVNSKGQKFILDKSLSDLEKEVSPLQFYRVNRKFLANISAIKRIKFWPKSKLVLEVEPSVNEDIIISQENVADFKQWMGG